MIYRNILMLIVSSVFAISLAHAQRAGQSISVQYGVVTSGKQVDLNSGAVPKGAVVGGALGLASAKGKKSSKRARNSIIGAVAGSAIAGSTQGDTRGMIYKVALTGTAGEMQVVTDQREIRIGDCVAVEKAGETANLRRVSDGFCDGANAQAVEELAEESIEEASECEIAKAAVVNAGTIEEAELAAVKMRLLCDD